MRNKYPGNCYRCGERVEAGAGHFERIPGGWRTQHADCAIKWRGTPDALRAQLNIQAAAKREKQRHIDALGTGKRAQRARARIRADQQRSLDQ